MLFLQITQMVLPVLAAMAIGFFCRRSGLLNAQGHAALKTVIGNITLPVVLFNAFLTAEYNLSLIHIFLLCHVLKVIVPGCFYHQSFFVIQVVSLLPAGHAAQRADFLHIQ